MREETAENHAGNRPGNAARGPVGAGYGVICDVDGAFGVNAARHPLRATRRLIGRSRRDLRSVLGMAAVLFAVLDAHPEAPVTYLTTAPRRLTGPIRHALARDGYPPGTVEAMTPGAAWRWWFRDGAAHKQAVVQRLATDHPELSWVLVGDDGDSDPDLYADLARRLPGRVAAIALRRVSGPAQNRAADHDGQVGDVPVVTAANGQELAPRLRACLGLTRPDGDGAHDWFLTAPERGNDASELPAWTDGNAVRALVHGRAYFPVLAAELADTGPADLVAFAAWRADSDELLADDGTTLAQALTDSCRRGAAVRALVWRSHARSLGFSAAENRDLAAAVNGAGGEARLDQRVRALGSHHQKLFVIRRPQRSAGDVAFVGGIDLAHSRRDDAQHRGDDQIRPFADAYGATPAWHDVQLELHGPAVADAELVFRERWTDPTALSRMPWQVLGDLVRGADRTASPLPAALPDPPRVGSCSVQLLRTYPRRWPGYPFAPQGERSIARGYAKALSQAQRLVYIEDQYLWSTDVARVFATALRRCPQLRLIAVAPRFPDQEGTVNVPSALLGQTAALAMVRQAGGDRVQVLDLEKRDGTPVYVHAKVCIIDDVWAAVGSSNFNRRSWTHDSELTAAILDQDRDDRAPADPAGQGDGARRFARELRLQLMREHLDRTEGDDDDLIDPDTTAAAVQRSAAALDAWHRGGRTGPRPPGRLRNHRAHTPAGWQRRLTAAVYATVVDPDGRPPGMKLRRTF